jgi:hypothetical protein
MREWLKAVTASLVCEFVKRSLFQLRPHARVSAAVALAIGLLTASGAQAGIEFVTPLGQCNRKVDQIGNGKNLFIIADQDVRFEVWGFQMDATKSVRVHADDDVHGNITARIIRTRSGLENSGRVDQVGTGCPFVGSVEVEVDSAVTFTVKRHRSLFLKVEVLGVSGEHRLPMTVKPYPRFSPTWTLQDVNCIVKTAGSIEKFEQDTLTNLRLPPGHQQDTTTCFNPSLKVRIARPAGIGELDISKIFRYSVSGLPSFLTMTSAGSPDTRPDESQELNFAIDTLGIRALTNTSNSTITIHSPNPNRTATVRLTVIPNAANGFTADASCNPDPLHVEGLEICHIEVALPAGPSGQAITWKMNSAPCFTPYDPTTNDLQLFHIPAGQIEANIPIRSVKQNLSDGSNCGSTAGITHRFDAWVGDGIADLQVTAAISGPTHTQDNITVLRP